MRWVSLKPLRKNYNLTLTNPDLSPHSLSTESSQRDLKFPVGKFLVVTRRFVPSPDDGREIEGLKWAQHILCIFQFEVDWAAILQWYCFHEGGTWFHHGPFSTARSKVTKCALGGEQFFFDFDIKVKVAVRNEACGATIAWCNGSCLRWIVHGPA